MPDVPLSRSTSPDVLPLSAALGAEFRGVRLDAAVDEAFIQKCRALLDQYGLLLFRDQSLDAATQVAVSRRFGPLQEVAQKQYQMDGEPLVYIIGNVRDGDRQLGDPSVGRLWHSDQSFLPHPAFGSLLYGVTCPPVGAETLFASMYKALAALPADLQRRLETLHAVHSFAEYYQELRTRDPSQPPLTDTRRALYPDVIHPLVRRNPRTGVKALYVNPGYTTSIVELPGSEGADLLAFLFEHACQERFVYSHQWREGDVLFWDNLATNHKGTDFDTSLYVRRMHRTTVASNAEAYEATLLS